MLKCKIKCSILILNQKVHLRIHCSWRITKPFCFFIFIFTFSKPIKITSFVIKNQLHGYVFPFHKNICRRVVSSINAICFNNFYLQKIAIVYRILEEKIIILDNLNNKALVFFFLYTDLKISNLSCDTANVKCKSSESPFENCFKFLKLSLLEKFGLFRLGSKFFKNSGSTMNAFSLYMSEISLNNGLLSFK